MKKLGIKSIIIKKYRPTTSKSKIKEQENVLKRDFKATTINEKWVTVYVNLKVPQNIIEISPRGNLKYPYDKS
ncbi:transposase (fragment) [Acetoanaerobium sticklandii]|uniref:Transposase n=2 Tax=Acetoanaerobium sticklandii TaxID=1511 RepID=E3PWX6_ACESD